MICFFVAQRVAGIDALQPTHAQMSPANLISSRLLACSAANGWMRSRVPFPEFIT